MCFDDCGDQWPDPDRRAFGFCRGQHCGKSLPLQFLAHAIARCLESTKYASFFPQCVANGRAGLISAFRRGHRFGGVKNQIKMPVPMRASPRPQANPAAFGN